MWAHIGDHFLSEQNIYRYENIKIPDTKMPTNRFECWGNFKIFAHVILAPLCLQLENGTVRSIE